jgi:hypothetical protein
MDGSRSRDDLARDLARRYGLEEEKATRDLIEFTDDLALRGAAHLGEGPSGTSAPPAEPPEATAYEPPTVVETEPLDVVAALCSSIRETGKGPPQAGQCRSWGGCQSPFE